MSTETHTLEDESMENVLERVDEAVCALDDELRFTFVNGQAADMLEYGPEKLLGEPISEAVPDIDDGIAEKKLHEAMETGAPARFDSYNERTDRWFKVRIYPGEDGVTACFYDITEDRKAQLELERKQRLFETVFGETDDALVIVDTDGRITEFNPAARRLFGYDGEEILGEQADGLFATPADDGTGPVNRPVRGDQEETVIVEYERSDGTTFEGETVVTSLEGPDSEPLAVLWSVRDASARIEYEQEIEAQNSLLRTFQEIATDESRSFEEQIETLLELGTDHLGLGVGTLSNTGEEAYTVEHATGVGEDVTQGDQFELGGSYSDLVVERERLLAADDVAEAGVAGHPIDGERAAEPYVGAPVVVDGDCYGTLDFTGGTRQEPFTEGERTFVRLLAQWLGKELSRRQSKERAAQSRDRLRQIIDTLPQYVFAKDRAGEYILANQAIAEAYGTTVEELEGATDADFAESAEEVRQFREDDIAVIDSGEAKPIPEEQFTTAAGEQLTVQTTKIPYDPVDRETEAVLAVVTDITELKQRERELEETTQRLNVALEGTNAGIWELDLETEEVVWTDSAEQLFGIEPGTFEGTFDAFAERVHPDDIDDVEQSLEQVGQDAETVQTEYRVKRDDGDEIWIEARAELRERSDGSERLVGTLTDITDRKERNAELELQSEAMEVAMDGIAILDDDEYVYMNQAHADVFDYEPEQLMGREWRDRYDEAEIDRFEAEVFPSLAEDGEWRGEALGRKRDGTAVYQDLGLSLLDSGELICTNRDITEQKEREQELERQRTRIRALFDQSPDGVIIHDGDGAVIDANETVAGNLGVDRETLFSMNVSEFEVGIDDETLRSIWDGMTAGETLKTEGEHRRQNGEVFPVEVWVNRVDVAGNERYIAVSRDISERKKREEELKRSRNFIEKAQESASIGGWEVDLSTERLRWTDEVYRIHDLPTGAEITVEESLAFYHPEDRPTIQAAFDRLTSRGEPYDLELRLVTADDRVRWVRAVGDPQFDDDGSVVGAVGVFQDITDRKQREEELRDLKERLDLAVEGGNIGIWDWNMETDAVTFNEQWASMLGFSLDELEPHLETWEDRVHPGDMAGVEKQLEAHLAGETELYDCEHRMQTKAGEWKWIRDVGKVVERDDEGTPTRAVGIHLDITDRKESELYLQEERDMFAQGPAVVFKWENDDGWPVEYVSENVTETFGYTPEQLQSGAVPYTTLVHEEDLDRVTAEVEKHSDGTTDRFSHDPYRMVTESGEIRWVTDNTKIIRTDGEITHYLGYLIDITEQKRLEQSLRDGERSLRELTGIASDTEQSFEEKLSALLELGTERLGLPYGFLNRIDQGTQHVVQAVGEHPQLQTGATAPASESYCRKTVRGDDNVLDISDAVAEGWGDDPAYERFDLGCYIGGKVFVDGDLYGTLCFADQVPRTHDFDDTERAFVELLVQWISYELATDAFESKLQQINHTAQQLMTATSREEIAAITTENTKSILGMGLNGIWWHDEANSRLVPECMTDESAEFFGEQPVLREGTSLAYDAFEADEVRLYADLDEVDGLHNEKTRLGSEAIVPFGEYGVMSAGSTEHHAFSETDINLLEVLSATVRAALTRAQREETLRETQRQLKRSNEELEQFAYAASHDLQEPLRTVSSYLTLLERRYSDSLDEDAVEFIEFAVDGADRMREMIQALLVYSRVDSRGQEFEPVDAGSVFERVTGNLEVAIEEAGATVVTPEVDVTISGDESQLVQLFQNLTENAIKYNEGTPRVEITATPQDGMVTFEVSDDGIGIETDQTEEIFEVFQRLHTHEEFDGTGIGLSICRKIVDRHGGEISVESEPGEGSTFAVTLPQGGVNDD